MARHEVTKLCRDLTGFRRIAHAQANGPRPARVQNLGHAFNTLSPPVPNLASRTAAIAVSLSRPGSASCRSRRHCLTGSQTGGGENAQQSLGENVTGRSGPGRMRAVICCCGELEVADLPAPEPGTGQIVLDVKRAGICGSDLHLRTSLDQMASAASGAGGSGFGTSDVQVVFGHEFSGEVGDYGPDTNRRWKPGTLMVAMPVCRHGRHPHVIGTSPQAPGAFTEQVVVQIHRLCGAERPARRTCRADRAHICRLARRSAQPDQARAGRLCDRLRPHRAGHDRDVEGQGGRNGGGLGFFAAAAATGRKLRGRYCGRSKTDRPVHGTNSFL